MRAFVLLLAGLFLLMSFAFMGFGLRPIEQLSYEARTPEAKRALASRIETLRTVLRADPHFEERHEYPFIWFFRISCGFAG
jgi:hypothetical protein